MANLAQETARVGDVLERIAEHTAPAPKPTPTREIGRVEEPSQHRPAEALLSVPGVWEHFRPVPEDFYAREGGTVVFQCPCGWSEPEDADMRQHRIDFGELLECPGCLRVYWLGKGLHAARADDAPGIEHSHPDAEPCLPPCPEYL
jgi:hypothetical protein